MIKTFLVFIVGTVWGSFLNCFSYRIIRGIGLGRNSFCPTCNTPIPWYDLVPVVSWLALGGQCRACKQPISYLYPIIELITAFLFVLFFFYVPQQYWVGYGIFGSALMVTMRSDAECMLISRAVTLYLIPFMFFLSLNGHLPLSLWQSIAGASGGYLFMWAVASLFYWFTDQEGMGQGDIDLLSFIGSGTGIVGCWASIFIGSMTGCIAALIITSSQSANPASGPLKIPFGVFLAGSALIYVLFESHLVELFYHFS